MPQAYRAPWGYEGGSELLLYAPAHPHVFFIGIGPALFAALPCTTLCALSAGESVCVLPTCQAVLATGSYGLHSAELAHLRRRVGT